MLDEAKVQFLFRKVQHRPPKFHRWFKSFTNKGYDHIVHHGYKPFVHRNFWTSRLHCKYCKEYSGIKVGDEAKGGDGIYNENGLIKTGHIPSWKLLPFKDQNLVIDKRKRLGIIYKGESGAKSEGRGNSNHSAADFNRFNKFERTESYRQLNVGVCTLNRHRRNLIMYGTSNVRNCCICWDI